MTLNTNFGRTIDPSQAQCVCAAPKCAHTRARIVYDDDPLIEALELIAQYGNSPYPELLDWLVEHDAPDPGEDVYLREQVARHVLATARLDTVLLCPHTVNRINANVAAGTFEELTRGNCR